MSQKYGRVSVIALGMACFGSGSAFAQAAPQSSSPPPGQESNPAVPAAPQPDEPAPSYQGDILVTALRRQQSAQDVPIAITAIAGDTLTERGITQPIDLAKVTPGLSTANATSGGTPIFAVRGIGLDDFNPNNNSGVAEYIDDVGISSPMLLSGQLFDVDRVEVLKGPQGTLYGKNATGGAVNIYSRQPTETPEGYFRVGFARWDRLSINGALSGKLADGLTARVAGSYDKAFDGWQTDIDTGRKFGKPDRLALRGILKYEPATNFTATLSVHTSRDRSITLSPQADGNEALLGPGAAGKIDTGTDDPTKVRVGALSPRRNDNGVGGSLNLVFKGNGFTVTSITGLDRYRYRSVDNLDGIPGPTFNFFQNDVMKQFYQEVRVASSRGLFGGALDWVVGASYSFDSVRGLDRSDQSAPFIGAFLTPPDFTTSGLSIAQADYRQTRKSAGIFANGEVHLTKSLSVVAGIRWSYDQLRFDGVTTEEGSVDGGVIFQGIGSVVDSLNDKRNVSKWSYKAGVNYKVGRAILLYGSVSSAYKQGAYYASPALDQQSWGFVKPEDVTAYEIGAKTRLFDSKLVFNVSLFQMDYKNRQSSLLYISPFSGFPVASLGTIPKSRIKGFEVEAHARPVAGLDLSASLAHLDTKVLVTATDVRGAPLYAVVPVGSDLAQSPHWTYQLNGRYEHAVFADWKGALQVDYNWSGQQRGVLADPNAIYGPTKSLGSRVELSQAPNGFSIALWGRNLTNENSNIYSSTSFYGGRALYRQEPRSYGVELGFKF